MKKIMFTLLGVVIVNLSASTYKISIPLDIDSIGNNEIIYNNQSYTIDTVKVYGAIIYAGGHYRHVIGEKTIPLSAEGIHETISFENNNNNPSYNSYMERPDVSKVFNARVSFCSTSANKCFWGYNNTSGNYLPIEGTNFATFTESSNLESYKSEYTTE